MLLALQQFSAIRGSAVKSWQCNTHTHTHTLTAASAGKPSETVISKEELVQRLSIDNLKLQTWAYSTTFCLTWSSNWAFVVCWWVISVQLNLCPECLPSSSTCLSLRVVQMCSIPSWKTRPLQSHVPLCPDGWTTSPTTNTQMISVEGNQTKAGQRGKKSLPHSAHLNMKRESDENITDW